MKKVFLLSICALMFAACKKKEDSKCERNNPCTLEFVSIGFSFENADHTPAETEAYSAVNQRTGKQVVAESAARSSLVPGSVLVADDGNINEFSAEGDEVKISAKNKASGQVKSALIKISGGRCSCHIKKISGPEKIIFD